MTSLTPDTRSARHLVADGEADFQRALGRVVVAGARLESLAPGGEPIAEENVRSSWMRRAGELLARRDDILAGIAHDAEASSMLRLRSVDGSIVAVDAHELETLATRMLRHRAAGLALGFAVPDDGEPVAAGTNRPPSRFEADPADDQEAAAATA